MPQSTYGNDDGTIFEVQIKPEELYTLRQNDVDTEINAKLALLEEIKSFEKKVLVDDRVWIADFKKLVTTERQIIERLQVPLSDLNTDGLDHINNPELRRKISDGIYANLQKALQDYLGMIKTFDFNAIVWGPNRSFLGNPFTAFLGKDNDQIENLKVTPLKKAFSKAVANVTNVKKAVNGIVSSFTSSMKSQKKKSETVMNELRTLNSELMLCLFLSLNGYHFMHEY